MNSAKTGYDFTFSIPPQIKSNEWQKYAMSRSKEIAKQHNVDWTNTSFFVRLPEQGRCFIKEKSFKSFGSHG